MSITYRKATSADISLLAETRVIFINEMIKMQDDEKHMLYSSCEEYFVTAMKDNSFASFLAFDGELLAATSGICFYRIPPVIHRGDINDGFVAYIQNMYTYPNYRKKGIATKLFKMTVEEAKIRGYRTLKLHATDMGRPIYEKFGFTDSKNDMEIYLEG